MDRVELRKATLEEAGMEGKFECSGGQILKRSRPKSPKIRGISSGCGGKRNAVVRGTKFLQNRALKCMTVGMDQQAAHDSSLVRAAQDGALRPTTEARSAN